MTADDPTPIDCLAGPSPSRIANALRAGSCPSDRAFDAFLPEDLRRASGEYWTPLAVALRAAQWLREIGARCVIDIGAGPGKFCIAAALAGEGDYVGLEHRHRLVTEARWLARLFGVNDRVRFIEGTLVETPLPAADAYYLYNPFAENLFGPGGYLDREVGLGCDRYALDVGAAQSMFRRAPAGTIVVTYNGFGGLMPASYELLRVERDLPCVLSLWQKLQPPDDGGFLDADSD